MLEVLLSVRSLSPSEIFSYYSLFRANDGHVFILSGEPMLLHKIRSKL